MRASINKMIKNCARGGAQYRGLRLRIAEAITAQNENVEPLSDFLAERFFDLKNGTWVNLALNDKDWAFVARLRSIEGRRFNRSYLNLALNYITANANRIKAMYEVEAEISRLLLKEGPDVAEAHWNKLDKKDVQSLFASRLACALRHSAKDELVAHFSTTHYSDWMRKRFLYPFIYFFINRPPDEFIDSHLSHLLPPGYENAQERTVIEFLLRDELAYEENLAFKCYVALAAHPYDACEFLLNHCEVWYAKTGTLGELEKNAIDVLESIVPASRKEFLPALFGREACLRELRVDIAQVDGTCLPREQFGNIVEALLGSEISDSNRLLPLNIFLRAAVQLRINHYPQVHEYDTVVAFSHVYWFTAAGRLLGAYLTSLYLLPRREQPFEARQLFRLAGFCGGITPLLATSPRSFQHLLGSVSGSDPAALANHIALLDVPSGDRSDRLWINRIHFELSKLENSGHFKVWLQKVFESLPVMPAYLTGIDWSWFSEMIKLLRIGPFRGSPAGIYVLLLQHIEGRWIEMNTLRIAVEPVAIESGGLDQFLKWCITSFAEKTVALVRYFLTADMLLWLKLEVNYVAALSSRMRAIEICAREFGLSPLLTEENIIQEQRAYTAALLSINLGANQFEISWDILKKDVSLSQGDVYDAYLAFRADIQASSVLTQAKLEVDYPFAIGRHHKYSITNRDWPLFNVIMGVINTLMEHPSQGIESILAIRIRHNTLRREYLAVVAQLKRSNIPNVSGADRIYIVPRFGAAIGRAVQDWVDKFMHQRRPGKDSAVFDFVPTQDDLDGLLDRCREYSESGQIFDMVASWIKNRLDGQLKVARGLLSRELAAAMEVAVNERVLELQSEEPHFQSIREIGRVLVAALNQQTDKLTEWFSLSAAVGSSVSVSDLHLAVCERFQAEIDGGVLQLGRPTGKNMPDIIKENVRMVYDLWCEAVLNAVKHSEVEEVRVRVTSYGDDSFAGLVFSSSCKKVDNIDSNIAGHPYTSIQDALFRDIQSGLAKIACLSASAAGSEIVVRAVNRPGFFHLIVPLTKLQPEFLGDGK